MDVIDESHVRISAIQQGTYGRYTLCASVWSLLLHAGRADRYLIGIACGLASVLYHDRWFKRSQVM